MLAELAATRKDRKSSRLDINETMKTTERTHETNSRLMSDRTCTLSITSIDLYKEIQDRITQETSMM